jgi:hypothetical protein
VHPSRLLIAGETPAPQQPTTPYFKLDRALLTAAWLMSHRRNRYMRLEATNCGGGKGALTTLRSIVTRPYPPCQRFATSFVSKQRERSRSRSMHPTRGRRITNCRRSGSPWRFSVAQKLIRFIGWVGPRHAIWRLASRKSHANCLAMHIQVDYNRPLLETPL